ncbi:2,3-bisphosphoglycerate-independent phosphoglycerate mutase [Candidatus Berkelbacteria bacterium CG10_big_fil_rev_8_21_14_0_10_41_12]|uniref:2,3-bisphosphoglycerate-independent phosphoglycerate mutase n=1 Tax=Candidatus Berkelbacteria bacterium CG10_big_fil_rev_8_21_14_0_10_41_12 TaxID=1974513 RepID=A0A2M6WXA6_9BACT|nr:MAG: 2,3-bisphosphoglycerate-independent phosphoglycerate mutase [Candidatus Berkelbacteria bacterium CG10_big_fil_rev_8_21_14_0_10_41_12]
MNRVNPLLLIILDGWGIAQPWGGNAISSAQTPTYNKIWRQGIKTELMASGRFVGLPGHEMGNSEVGHTNIGAGRIINQDITIINKSIADGSFYTNEHLLNAIIDSRNRKVTLHLIGLVSDGGVHSHINHLFALIKLCHDNNLPDVKIHAITDGRDSDTMSAIEYLTKLNFLTRKLNTGKTVSLIGRFYAMDRDNRWERIEKAYNLFTNGTGTRFKTPLEAISYEYRNGKTDEFIDPCTFTTAKGDLIKDGDNVIFFNFRSDRARELTESLTNPDFDKFKTQKLNLNFLTFVPYGISHDGVKNKISSAFEPKQIKSPFAQMISNNGLKQLHAAETEKYPHVTYFFNGNREDPFPGEDRVMVPSPKVKTYDLKPEMSSFEITKGVIERIEQNKYSFILVNYANADMVGHTGNFQAVVKAIEFLDKNLKEIIEKATLNNLAVAITADHGNAEQMINPITGDIDTEHTTNPVPFIILNPKIKINSITHGRLSNIANTLTHLMGLKTENYYDNSLIS